MLTWSELRVNTLYYGDNLTVLRNDNPPWSDVEQLAFWRLGILQRK